MKNLDNFVLQLSAYFLVRTGFSGALLGWLVVETTLSDVASSSSMPIASFDGEAMMLLNVEMTSLLQLSVQIAIGPSFTGSGSDFVSSSISDFRRLAF